MRSDTVKKAKAAHKQQKHPECATDEEYARCVCVCVWWAKSLFVVESFCTAVIWF